jgi:hypothetical protein
MLKITDTYENRVAEFEKNQRGCKSDSLIPNEKSSNPYYTARLYVLANYPEWKKKQLLEMEKIHDIDNSTYMRFVKDVAKEGDKRS